MLDTIRERWSRLRSWAVEVWPHVVTVLGAVGLVAAVVLVWFLSTGRLTVEKVGAYSTLVLIFITGVYALLTYELVRESRASRRQQVRPELVFEVGRNRLLVRNVGEGHAHRVTVRLCLNEQRHDTDDEYVESSDGAHRTAQFPTSDLGVGESFSIYEGPHGNVGSSERDVHDDYASLAVSMEYSDLNGNSYDQQFTEPLESFSVKSTPRSEPLDRLEDKVGGIESELRTIRHAVESHPELDTDGEGEAHSERERE
jgi:hypothetical protein